MPPGTLWGPIDTYPPPRLCCHWCGQTPGPVSYQLAFPPGRMLSVLGRSWVSPISLHTCSLCGSQPQQGFGCETKPTIPSPNRDLGICFCQVGKPVIFLGFIRHCLAGLHFRRWFFWSANWVKGGIFRSGHKMLALPFEKSGSVSSTRLHRVALLWGTWTPARGLPSTIQLTLVSFLPSRFLEAAWGIVAKCFPICLFLGQTYSLIF